MTSFTKKEDLKLAARTLAFAVDPDAAGGILTGLKNRTVSRRAVDSAILLTEVTGETPEGMLLHADILTFRDYPAVKLCAALENRGEHSLCPKEPIFLPDMEFCGSLPRLLSNGIECRIISDEIVRSNAEEYRICTEESSLAVRTDGKISLRRSPCGYLLRVGTDCPELKPGCRYSLPSVLLVTAAGNEDRLCSLLSDWDRAHSIPFSAED